MQVGAAVGPASHHQKSKHHKDGGNQAHAHANGQQSHRRLLDEIHRPAAGLAGDVTGGRQQNAEHTHAQANDQLLAEHHPGGVEACGVCGIGINRVRQQRPGNQVGGGGSETYEHDQADQGNQFSTASAVLQRWERQREQTGQNPEAGSPAQRHQAPLSVRQQAPELQACQGAQLKRQQDPGGQIGRHVHHLHQPDQGHHLHQLQAKPQQQVQPQNHQESGVGTDPLELLQRRFALVAGALSPLGKGGQPPAAGEGGQGRDGACDPAHAQVALGAIAEHQRGHNQAAEPGQDRPCEARGVQAGANGCVGGELGGEGCIGQVHAGVSAHQQDRHHHVIKRALGQVPLGNPPHRCQADAQG